MGGGKRYIQKIDLGHSAFFPFSLLPHAPCLGIHGQRMNGIWGMKGEGERELLADAFLKPT